LPSCEQEIEKGDMVSNLITAIDTHAHVLMRDLPMTTDRHSPLVRDYELAELLREMDDHRISHVLLTAPSVYDTDNTLLLNALEKAGGRARGTVILDPAETPSTIARLAALGVCGIRLNWWRKRELPDIRLYRPLLETIRDAGWHLELFLDGVHMPAVLPVVRDSGVNLVLDHFGCPEPTQGCEGPGFRCMLDMIQEGRTWVKLSAPYRLGGGDAMSYAHSLLQHAGPQRLLWGSDWPWGGFEKGMSYGGCIQWLHQWVPDEAARQTILIDTPARLFGFTS
jgi:predicted TIM-barrel fold metal-dependent hydrolase